MRIDLVRLGPPAADTETSDAETSTWHLGQTWQLVATPAAVAGFAAPVGADHLLFWAAELGAPDPRRILEIAGRPGEIHHAGLALGQAGRPRLLDFVHPTWMLNRDPPPEIGASSWRLSLRALLVPAAWWQEAGPRPHYRTLDAAALELGWRWLLARRPAPPPARPPARRPPKPPATSFRWKTSSSSSATPPARSGPGGPWPAPASPAATAGSPCGVPGVDYWERGRPRPLLVFKAKMRARRPRTQ